MRVPDLIFRSGKVTPLAEARGGSIQWVSGKGGANAYYEGRALVRVIAQMKAARAVGLCPGGNK